MVFDNKGIELNKEVANPIECVDLYLNGMSIVDLREKFFCTEEAVLDVLRKYEVLIQIGVTDESQMHKAPRVKHRSEIITDPETGKVYHDITDYVVDCGLGV